MLELLRAGGPVMWPLLGCSLLTVAVILERSWFWWRLERGRDEVVERVVRAARGDTPQEAAARLRIAAEREAAELERYLGLLGTMVSLAPLLGIFGTVLGIMESFQFLDAGSLPAPQAARQGLARALLTTAFGLAIAMVSLIAQRIFQWRVVRLRQALEERCSEVELELGLGSGGGEA